MANVYATKTGNWSDTTVWNTGALPTSADDVFSNTYTVTIDQDVTVKSIRNTSATGITAGGGFTVSGAYTIDASGGTGFYSSGATTLTCNNAAGTTTNIKGNNQSAQLQVFAFANAGTVNYTGSLTYSSAISTYVAVISGTGTTNITGSLTAANNASCAIITGAAVVNITGSITGLGNNTSALVISANATVTITGNLSASSTNASTGALAVSSNSTVIVTGAVTGSGTGTQGAIVITGNYAGTLTVNGTLTASAGPAIISVSSGSNYVITCSGPFVASALGQLPLAGYALVKVNRYTNNEVRMLKASGGTMSFWSSDVNSGAPSVANVRSGTKFGVSNEFTGTLAVPPANSVASGVPVDNTVGTAALSPSDLSSVIGAAIAAALDSVP